MCGAGQVQSVDGWLVRTRQCKRYQLHALAPNQSKISGSAGRDEQFYVQLTAYDNSFNRHVHYRVKTPRAQNNMIFFQRARVSKTIFLYFMDAQIGTRALRAHAAYTHKHGDAETI